MSIRWEPIDNFWPYCQRDSSGTSYPGIWRGWLPQVGLWHVAKYCLLAISGVFDVAQAGMDLGIEVAILKKQVQMS